MNNPKRSHLLAFFVLLLLALGLGLLWEDFNTHNDQDISLPTI